MINSALMTRKAIRLTSRSVRSPAQLVSGSMLLAMLLLSGCNNSMDLRSQHSAHNKASAEDNMSAQANMHSAQAAALSVTEAASAARYINNQDVMQAAFSETENVTPLPSESLVKQFAGRYTGQIPCTVQSVACANDKLDITLTLLPDGSAIRTLVAQGKVNAMLEKETANWTVSANGQNIMLILPNHEIWSFRKIGNNRLQFQPRASAMVEPADALGQYSLVAANS